MTELAKRYGGSLYELAAEESLTEPILQELTLAESSFKQEPQYLRLLQTPSIPKKERCGLLDKAFEGMHPYVVNFLKILCEEDLLGELSGCLEAYRERYNADHGIMEATVTSAVPLSAEEREKLLHKIPPYWADCVWIWQANVWTVPCSAVWNCCATILPTWYYNKQHPIL